MLSPAAKLQLPHHAGFRIDLRGQLGRHTDVSDTIPGLNLVVF